MPKGIYQRNKNVPDPRLITFEEGNLRLEKMKSRCRFVNKETFVHSHKKTSVLCLDCGHIREAMPSDVYSGHGCPKCAGNFPYTAATFNAELLARGRTDIKLISESFNGTGRKHKFLCHMGHESFKFPLHVLNKKGMCTQCITVKYVGEENTYTVLKQLLNVDINRNLHIKVNIPETQQDRIYVDFQFEINGQNYFIEYNGEQHYKLTRRLNDKEKFKRRQARDQFLREYSLKINTKLIEIDGRILREVPDIKDFLTPLLLTHIPSSNPHPEAELPPLPSNPPVKAIDSSHIVQE